VGLGLALVTKESEAHPHRGHGKGTSYAMGFFHEGWRQRLPLFSDEEGMRA